MTRIFGYLLLGLLVAATLVQAAVYAPQLPDRLASHFDAAGRPDGWMSKRMFFGFNVGMQLGMAVLLVGLAKLTRRLPVSLINFPNKTYWLAAERRDATFSHLEGCMLWIAVATAALLVAIFQLTIQANLTNGPLANGPFLVALVSYLGCILIFCLHVYRRFGLPDEETFDV